jgi:hypothetical protein
MRHNVRQNQTKNYRCFCFLFFFHAVTPHYSCGTHDENIMCKFYPKKKNKKKNKSILLKVVFVKSVCFWTIFFSLSPLSRTCDRRKFRTSTPLLFVYVLVSMFVFINATSYCLPLGLPQEHLVTALFILSSFIASNLSLCFVCGFFAQIIFFGTSNQICFEFNKSNRLKWTFSFF